LAGGQRRFLSDIRVGRSDKPGKERRRGDKKLPLAKKNILIFDLRVKKNGAIP